MDKITHENLHKFSHKHGGTHGDKYPYIDFDEDGNAYLVTERGAIAYPYANTDADSGTNDDTGTGYVTSDGDERDGYSGTDADAEAHYAG